MNNNDYDSWTPAEQMEWNKNEEAYWNTPKQGASNNLIDWVIGATLRLALRIISGLIWNLPKYIFKSIFKK